MEIALIIGFFALLFWLRSLSIRLFGGKKAADSYLNRKAKEINRTVLWLLFWLIALFAGCIYLLEILR